MKTVHRLSIIFIAAIAALQAWAADPMATTYSWSDCQGTFKPYPQPETEDIVPDSLAPLMINHVGRHGARYASSPRAASRLRKALTDIEENRGGLTPLGRQLAAITDRVIEASSGRWGSLSQLGMAEQRGIASRMFKAYRPLFTEGRVNAISSYSPRCIMSMYEFVHQLSRLDNDINVTTLSGHATSTLMRFFDGNTEFKEYLESDELRQTISNYEIQMTPLDPMLRLMAKPAIADATEARKLVSDEFDVLTGLEAISMSCKASDFFTTEEQNALWSCANFSHYMKRSANTLSTLPADIAAPLLRELVASFERFIENPQSEAAVQLRFGHAETLMPLLALMRLHGCYYLTRYYDTVGKNWCDFHVTPMAANLQLILFRSNSGRLYIKALLNETAVPLIPGKPDIYVSWPEARDYLNRCTDFIL